MTDEALDTCIGMMSQSLFYWIIYSYVAEEIKIDGEFELSQSLFYWIIYSYLSVKVHWWQVEQSLNPYFIGLSILITEEPYKTLNQRSGLNPYFIGLSILIFIWME